MLFFLIRFVYSLEINSIPSFRTPPQARQYSTMSASPNDNMIYVYGGNDGLGTGYDTVWQYNISLNYWSELVTISQ